MKKSNSFESVCMIPLVTQVPFASHPMSLWVSKVVGPLQFCAFSVPRDVSEGNLDEVRLLETGLTLHDRLELTKL